VVSLGYNHCPEGVRTVLDSCVASHREVLGDALLGVYLHGSLAMDCFNPQASDIDILAVSRRETSKDQKKEIIQWFLDHSRKPSLLEYSLLNQDDLRAWRHPCAFDLHYSEMHRNMYKKGDGDGLSKNKLGDPDLAAHLTITKARGLVLWGKPIDDVFPEIPARDYKKSLLYDFKDIAKEVRTKKVSVYSLLNPCRVAGYFRDGLIMSKDEGGEWGMKNFPDMANEISKALAMYRGDVKKVDFDALKAVAFIKEIESTFL